MKYIYAYKENLNQIDGKKKGKRGRENFKFIASSFYS